jgi:glycosyltransferase involved in cell wall biosynthesis
LRLGIKNAKHVLMLGNNTKNDIKSFFKYNLDDPKKPNYINHTIIYNGVNPKYLTQKHSNKHKADLISSSFEMTELNEKNEILKKFKITKPYFFFISIWRKYKNVENLVDAFELFQKKHENKYQLVLSGSSDPSYPEVYQKVINSNQYKLGNIIITNKIENDEDVIKLYDNSIAMINATLSEGFGLWMVESAVRGTNVICSDIDTLREIAGQNDAVFFNPKDINDIAQKMSDFVNLDQDKKDNMAKNLYQSVQKFKWEKTAQTVYNTIKEIQYDQN